MKLLCETQVFNREIPHTKFKSRKATLSLGFYPPGKENAEVHIIHFTAQNRTGIRYKVKNNVEKVLTKFVNDGKATISFKIPECSIHIKCDPIQLKCFLQALKLALDGKHDMNKIGLCRLGAMPIPNKLYPITKCVITKKVDYPMRGFPKTIKSLFINGIKRNQVGSEILFLPNLTILSLSENLISVIPKEVGLLSLIEIDFSNNRLGESQISKDWEWLKGNRLKQSLKSLDLSTNMISYFPYELVKLHKLVTLKLNNNSIKKVPFAIRRLSMLRYLHLSSNKLESLPQTISRLRLDVLDVWENNFLPIRVMPSVESFNETECKMPSLWEMAARVILSKKGSIKDVATNTLVIALD